MIRVETNQPVAGDAGQAFLTDLSRTAARLLGKPEAYVMVGLYPGVAMRFAGSDAPLAYIEMKSIGLQTVQTSALSRGICAFVHERLGIDPARIYIEFASATGNMWGWNSETF
jgi:phenylpyruvate tautomerase PptA (4-oxalocrotonate tautomerase family)